MTWQINAERATHDAAPFRGEVVLEITAELSLHVLALFLNLFLELITAGLDVRMVLGRLNTGSFFLIAGDPLVDPLEDIGLVLIKIGTGHSWRWSSIGCEYGYREKD